MTFTVNNGYVALKEGHTTEQINTIEHFFFLNNTLFIKHLCWYIHVTLDVSGNQKTVMVFTAKSQKFAFSLMNSLSRHVDKTSLL